MKKLISFTLCLVCFAVQMFSLSGCKNGNSKVKFTDYSFDSFDTVTTIVGYETSKELFDSNCDKIKSKLNEYHKLYTIYSRYEGIDNLCALNNMFSESSEPIKTDAKIIDLLAYSKEMYEKTGGKLNVAMGSVLSIWHKYREEGLRSPEQAQLPAMDELKSAAMHTDISNLVVDEENQTVYSKDQQLKLDVGAIAKGYAVERVATWMGQQGITGYILNVGGNVRIVGKRPDGEKWKVGIENPDTENEDEPYIEYLQLEDISLVTSGSYQRYYTVAGKSYHHIIDPLTLMPSNNFKSVSVLCEDSGQADTFSTAVFCMSYEEGKEFIETCEDTEAMWVMPNGEKRYSSGFKKYCYND